MESLAIDARKKQPGRVVTLIPSTDPASEVWGIAYKIREEDIEKVTNQLDYREKNGYQKKILTFHPMANNIKPFDLTLYVATEENESYAGQASIEEIAKQVVSCHGPSGSNKEYVYKLASSMRQLAPHIKDSHLYDLDKAVAARAATAAGDRDRRPLPAARDTEDNGGHHPYKAK